MLQDYASIVQDAKRNSDQQENIQNYVINAKRIGMKKNIDKHLMVEDDIIAKKDLDDWAIKVKEFYAEMLKIQEANDPDSYLIPKSVWDELLKKLQYFERALVNAKKSRDMWMRKYKSCMNY